MIQVKTFLVPQQEDAANAFLKLHKPAQQGINFNKDTIVIFYEEDPAADLVELLESVRNARFQQEVALHIAKRELADLNPSHNKARFDEVNTAVNNITDAIAIQEAKEAFVLQKIEEKRAAK
jgi:hypothetical protein